MNVVLVNSALGPYEVLIAPGALDQLREQLGEASRAAIIYPAALASVASRAAELLELPVSLIEVPEAEAAKTPEVLAGCWNRLAAEAFTRNDLIIGIGGGTTTDLAGFVAATWLRGVPYVSVPTSVLGMVDAAVGGKTGINLAAGKNLVGAFYEPRAVLCDLDLLGTLPEAEVSSGLAEVVKCGFISDEQIVRLVSDDLTESRDVTSARFAQLLTRAVAVKAEVVAADFKERSTADGKIGREALNYGHTLGHAIETHAGYTWRHGQAISVGMAWVARVSRELLGLSQEVVALHDELLGALGLPLSYAADFAELRPIMSLDKKARGHSLRLVGLSQLGTPTILAEPDETVLRAAYAELAQRT